MNPHHPNKCASKQCTMQTGMWSAHACHANSHTEALLMQVCTHACHSGRNVLLWKPRSYWNGNVLYIPLHTLPSRICVHRMTHQKPKLGTRALMWQPVTSPACCTWCCEQATDACCHVIKVHVAHIHVAGEGVPAKKNSNLSWPAALRHEGLLDHSTHGFTWPFYGRSHKRVSANRVQTCS